METNNKRIVRNTLYLYIRMLIIMALSFVSTRIVLDKLGASDYGVYTLVGGFISLFTVLNSILGSSTRRFLALYLGNVFNGSCYPSRDRNGCCPLLRNIWTLVFK